jgi:serine/threonine-protein kinase
MSRNLARSSFEDAARNLLFGLLALQNNFINRNVLVAAFGTWIADKFKPLDRVLLDQGHLDTDCHALLMGLVRQHLKLHDDDPNKSLEDLSSVGRVVHRLIGLGDAQLSATLGHVGTARPGDDDDTDTDFDATATFVGAPTSAGGRFRVLRLHAEGGLGEVYIARDEEVHRDVALKQIKPEHASDPQSRARFLVEAEITGGLEHPGIVPVYGLGTYDDGRPFYAMRFIRGDSLKGAIALFHSDQAVQTDQGRRTLGLQKLLRRFLDVCNAISYAHSRGVLHRDLKPGNIMLGDYGETLVVDWGLAKAIGRHLEPAAPRAVERTLRPGSGSDVQPTVVGSRLGTPAFMPPEQAAGRLDELGASSDVYSLGATLYVLLTGQVPFTEPDLQTVLRQVEQGVFPHPRQICPWIDPALEAVCLKAMARLPQDRYPTPRALAEDLEHWLADEPVAARRDPLWTRSWRWVRKHRTLATSGAAVVVLSAAALGIGLQRERLYAARIAAERTEAERRLDQLMTSYEEYFSGFNEEVLRGRKLPQPLLESLLAKPRAFYARLTTELAAKPAPTAKERALLARGHLGFGRILRILGRHADSERETEAARRLFEALAQDQPGQREYHFALATCYYHLGIVLAGMGRLQEAEQAYRQAIAALERLMTDQLGAPVYRQVLAGSYVNLGGVLAETGRVQDAELAYRKAIATEELLVRDHPAEPQYWDFLSNGYGSLGIVLARSGRIPEAEQVFGNAIGAKERLVNDQPAVPEYRHSLAGSYVNLGNVQKGTGRLQDAQQNYGKGIATLERLVSDQPAVPEYRHFLALGYNNAGNVLAGSDQLEQAEKVNGKAIATFERLVNDQPAVPEYRSGLARGLVNLGNILGRMTRVQEAERAYGKSIAVLERLVNDQPAVPDYGDSLANSYDSLGTMLAATGRVREAEQAYGKAIAAWERLVTDQPGSPDYQSSLATGYDRLGVALADSGRVQDAEQAYGKAVVAWERLLTRHPEVSDARSGLGAALNNLAMAHMRRGDFNAAILRFREAIGHQRAVFDRQPQVAQYRQFLSNHYFGLAHALRALGQAAEAAEATGERIKLWPGNPGQLYNVSCDYARCVPITRDGAVREHCADAAMAALRAAVAAGWSNAVHTARDPDLAPLHQRPDFRALLAELFDSGFPADPFTR